MDQTDAQQRAKWVERWKDSGLTANEFAAEAGLTVSALYNWSSQLSAARRKRVGRRSESTGQPMQPEGLCRAETRSATLALRISRSRERWDRRHVKH